MALDEKQIAEFKVKLEERKTGLENELSRFASPDAENPGDYNTRFDELGSDIDANATEVDAYTSNLALENTLETQLQEVTQALDRIEKGNFGVCTKCGKEINPERLNVYPSASICMDCAK